MGMARLRANCLTKFRSQEICRQGGTSVRTGFGEQKPARLRCRGVGRCVQTGTDRADRGLGIYVLNYETINGAGRGCESGVRGEFRRVGFGIAPYLLPMQQRRREGRPPPRRLLPSSIRACMQPEPCGVLLRCAAAQAKDGYQISDFENHRVCFVAPTTPAGS